MHIRVSHPDSGRLPLLSEIADFNVCQRRHPFTLTLRTFANYGLVTAKTQLISFVYRRFVNAECDATFCENDATNNFARRNKQMPSAFAN
ncbi:MAG: hypothetical protein WAK55_17945 [Xanthobacteraceae bacterium]